MQQSSDLWTVVPMLYLIIYLKIDNLSYTGITISNFIINDEFLVSKINVAEIKEALSLSFFASEECHNRDLEEYGQAISVLSGTKLEPNDYNLIPI
jgi:hypothetical protein